MQLVNTDGTAVALTLIGYQYPHLETALYDSNWLIIRIDATNAQGTWTATSPCLLTYEVSRLADWLDAAADDRAERPVCTFIEPSLLFRVREAADGRRMLYVYLEVELRPPWMPSKYAGQEDVWLAFVLDVLNLPATARMLRMQLQRYPQRAAR